MNNSLLLNTIECANFTAVNLKKKKIREDSSKRKKGAERRKKKKKKLEI